MRPSAAPRRTTANTGSSAPTGTSAWSARGKVIRDEAGEAIEMIGTAHDITERHRAEEALRESEERFRGTFENAAVGIAHKDADGRLLRVNESYCEIVGYTREELVHESFQDFTHPEDLAAELRTIPDSCGANCPATRWRSATSARTARSSGST